MSSPPEPDPSPALVPPRADPTRFRWAWLALAWFSLALGVIGIFLPIMPTAPFVIVAAFAAARGSKRLHYRLLRDKRFGHMIRDWYRYGAVKRSAKVLATLGMCGSGIGALLFSPIPWLAWTLVVILLAVIAWLWARPEPPTD